MLKFDKVLSKIVGVAYLALKKKIYIYKLSQLCKIKFEKLVKCQDMHKPIGDHMGHCSVKISEQNCGRSRLWKKKTKKKTSKKH